MDRSSHSIVSSKRGHFWWSICFFFPFFAAPGCSDEESSNNPAGEAREDGAYLGVSPSALVFPEGAFGSGGGIGSGGGPSSGGGGGGGTGGVLSADGPRTISIHCGDGVHDPAREECDDGPGATLDTCSQNCQTRDLLLVEVNAFSKNTARRLGEGLHSWASSISTPEGASAGALVWSETTPEARIGLRLLDRHGNPVRDVVVDEGAPPAERSRPAVAGLGDGSYAVAWTTLNANGAGLGIALRKVVPPIVQPTVSAVRLLQADSIGAQQDVDLIWAAGELVLAWSDTSDPRTGSDLRYQKFDTELRPTSAIGMLAGSEAPEGAVSLAPHGEGWIAAFRRAEPSGNETIILRSGAQSIPITPSGGGPFAPGAAHEPPALASLDEGHAVVVFTVGTDPDDTGVFNVFRLWGAVVDTTTGSTDWQGWIFPRAPSTIGDETRSQLEPVLAGNGPRVFLTWRSSGELGSPLGEDVWLKAIDWNGVDLDDTIVEASLPRDDRHRGGDQRAPKLGLLPVSGGWALGMAWEDWGATFSPDQARPDLAIQVAGLPLRRGPPVEKDCATTPCSLAEGPCAGDAQCAGSLVCEAGRGPWFGFGPETSVCIMSHCRSGMLDGDETGVDCGGSCGECFDCPTPAYENTAHYCSAVCRCSDAIGDCDYDTECVEGLQCVEDQGALIGHPAEIDLCIDPSCRDGVMNGDESRLDCGGSICPPCVVGLDNYCSTVAKCGEGLGSCASSSECNAGLSCAANQGPLYRLPAGAGVCVPSSCPSERNLPALGACSASCRCPDGYGSCASDADCLGTPNGAPGVCQPERGLYAGLPWNLGICAPDHCVNGVLDVGEKGVDCGGVCGTQCPTCETDHSFASFEYLASSAQPAGSRGWEYAGANSTITWSKDDQDSTHGSESLKFSGCGWTRVRSPAFDSADFIVVGDQLLLDWKLETALGSPLPSGEWVGTASLRLLAPNGTKYALVDLDFEQGIENSWRTASLILPSELQPLFQAATEGFRLEMDLGLSCHLPEAVSLSFDNLRFRGNAAFRSQCRNEDGGEVGTDVALDVMGFENPTRWSSLQTTPTRDASERSQGEASLSVPLGTAQFMSSSFPVRALKVDALLLADVFLPPGASGTLTWRISCPTHGIVNRALGSQSLIGVPTEQWFTLEGMAVPTDVRNVIASGFGSCSFSLSSNVSAPSGVVRFDNLRFAPDTVCNRWRKSHAAPFSLSMPVTPDGTVSRPYPLCSAAQIQAIMNAPATFADKHFVLRADIDLKGVNGTIGTPAQPFVGSLDGDGFELANFSSEGGSSRGLFGSSNGTIRNLKLYNFRISGSTKLGALAGENGGLIEKVSVRGSSVLSSSGVGAAYLGGLLGNNVAAGVVRDVTVEVVVSASWAGGTIGGISGMNSGVIRGASGFVDVAAVGGSRVGGAVGSLALSSARLERVSLDGYVVAPSSTWVGGLAGYSTGLTQASQSRVSVTGGVEVGGLVGFQSQGQISDSHALSRVTGTQEVGGLVGQSYFSFIERVSASGSVTGSSNYVGGLVGTDYSSAITDSYARGNVSGSSLVGGLAGHTDWTKLTRVYSSGLVSGASAAGGLVGEDGLLEWDDEWSEWYWEYSTTYTSALTSNNPMINPVGNSTFSPVEVIGAVALANPLTFSTRGWDLSYVWSMDGVGPVLRPDHCIWNEQSNVAPFVVGLATPPDGSAARPYLLCSVPQLQAIMNASGLWNKNYVLLKDLNLATVTGTIGTSATPFTGTFDGRGHRLSNYTRVAATHSVGLFGAVVGDGTIDGVTDGEIRSLTLNNFTVSGTHSVGALAGVLTTGQVYNIIAEGGTSSATQQQVGGVVGTNVGVIASVRSSVVVNQNNGVGMTGGITGLNLGLVSDCFATGRVNANWSLGGVSTIAAVGGLVGMNGAAGVGPGKIELSTASGRVEGYASAFGGLVGLQEHSSSMIVESRSTGTVDQNDPGLTYAGGLIGRAVGGTIRDSSSSSSVDSRSTRVGGLVGRIDSSGLIEDSYATGAVRSLGSRTGGLIGETSGATVRRSWATGNVTVESGGDVGGLIGYAYDLTLEDSYSRGNATGSTQRAGGICGYVNLVTIRRTYAKGTVSIPTNAGRLVGFVSGSGSTVRDSIGNSTVNPSLSLIGSGTGTFTNNSSITTAAFLTQSNYTARGWDFTNTWIMGSGGAVLR